MKYKLKKYRYVERGMGNWEGEAMCKKYIKLTYILIFKPYFLTKYKPLLDGMSALRNNPLLIH